MALGIGSRIAHITRYATYDTRLDPAIPVSWGAEGVHWRVWDWPTIDQYYQKGRTIPANHKYIELHLSVPSPADRLMTTFILDRIKDTWGIVVREGAPIRATLWWKGSIPMFQYVLFLEYHESPLIPIAAVAELLALVLAIVIGLKFLGFDAGTTQGLVSAPFTGMMWVFILGIGFIVVLSWVQPRLVGVVRPPEVPGVPKRIVPVERVAVGPPTAVERREAAREAARRR